jgi:hypothetical protein
MGTILVGGAASIGPYAWASLPERGAGVACFDDFKGCCVPFGKGVRGFVDWFSANRLA